MSRSFECRLLGQTHVIARSLSTTGPGGVSERQWATETCARYLDTLAFSGGALGLCPARERQSNRPGPAGHDSGLVTPARASRSSTQFLVPLHAVSYIFLLLL